MSEDSLKPDCMHVNLHFKEFINNNLHVFVTQLFYPSIFKSKGFFQFIA